MEEKVWKKKKKKKRNCYNNNKKRFEWMKNQGGKCKSFLLTFVQVQSATVGNVNCILYWFSFFHPPFTYIFSWRLSINTPEHSFIRIHHRLKKMKFTFWLFIQFVRIIKMWFLRKWKVYFTVPFISFRISILVFPWIVLMWELIWRTLRSGNVM